ncbi:hypothetical protein QCA50_014998 [Cerrena zonata]|uniref:Uncharacterized protein n=1 Tax=Cerrena zonata TaxID=2478898 RepID=A0AAW0FR42_9APHY
MNASSFPPSRKVALPILHPRPIQSRMVHRPADSRLLVNLLSHEKDYLKQLTNLLDHSQTSLASFSAFAAASAPPASQIIISVAGAFAGADEALRKYAFAVEQWQFQLKQLKETEDEVANIMRDREILVTRLIKASKSQKSTRESILAASSSSSTLSVKHEVQIGSKLSAAQTELQACESHLAIKERQLDENRVSTIRTGLHLRCKAMVECGWAWGEMGKEGLRALDMFEFNTHQSNGQVYSNPNFNYSKPLPSTTPDYGSSDHSSLAPSQSASNIASFDMSIPRSNYSNHQPTMNGGPYTLQIPPAHSISDFALPNGHAQQTTVEESPGSSAEEEEDIDHLEVHENPKFAPKNSSKPQKQQHSRSATDSRDPRQSTISTSRSEPFAYKSKYEPEPPKGTQRQRRGSHGVFGSIAALFHGKNHNSGDADADSGRWRTRTNKNISKAKRDDDSSDEEPKYNFEYEPVAGPSTSPPVIPDLSATARLRKRSLKRGSVQASSSAPRLSDVPEDRGWMSDGAATPSQSPRKKKGRPHPISISTDDVPPSKASPKTPRSKTPNGVLSAGLPTEVTLSRSSSLSKQSIMSAPATAPSQHTTIHPATPSKRASLPAKANANSTRRRTTSLNVDSLKSQNTGNVLSGLGYPTLLTHNANGKGKSSPRPMANGDAGLSLMSIVEDVRKNRDNWEKKQDPNRLLFMARAPPPVTDVHSLLDFSEDVEGKRSTHALKPERSLEPIEVLDQVSPQPSPPPDKRILPLRSALRNPSRSPSPTKSPPPSHPVAGPSKLRPPLVDTRRLSKDSDVSSIASFVTVQEDFDDDADESNPPSSAGTPQPLSSQLPQLSSLDNDLTPRKEIQQPTFAPPAPPPPPHDEPPSAPPKHDDHTVPAMTSDISNSNSTNSSTEGQPTRRKSVRMALPPTFSATPPAIDEDSEDEKRRHEPWAGRSTPTHTKPVQEPYGADTGTWASRIARDKDMWENSSDEDEGGEYGRAKKLLSVFARKS